jgi:hypothetical protein
MYQPFLGKRQKRDEEEDVGNNNKYYKIDNEFVNEQSNTTEEFAIPVEEDGEVEIQPITNDYAIPIEEGQQEEEPFYNTRRTENEPVKPQYVGINYTYIVENADDTLTDITTFSHIYTNVILRYHYPICMNITNVLTEIEKQNILTNEYEFVKTLIPENVKLYKIPRIIYDLLVIYISQTPMPRKKRLNCEFECYLDQCTGGNTDDDEEEDEEDEDEDEDMFDEATEYEMMEKMENKMYETEMETRNEDRIKCNTYVSYCKKANEYHHAQAECIFKLNNHILNYLKSKHINYKTPSYVDFMPILHDKQVTNNFSNTKLLIKTLLAETTQTYTRDKIMLFRGSKDQQESAVDNRDGEKQYGYSVSYNTSLLNGFINDWRACSYFYMGYDNFKHVYILNKFWQGDGGVEDNLFFIPPLHPYLQIFGDGELWHARSKIFKNSKIKRIENFGGKNYFPDFRLPDFLQSTYDKEQMAKRFRLFIAQHRAQIQDNQEEEHVETNLFGGRKTRRRRTKKTRKTKRKRSRKRKTRTKRRRRTRRS